MQNIELIKAVFGMLDEPVILTEREIIEYMNPPAIALAGEDKTGKSAGTILPSSVTDGCGEKYIASAFIGGKTRTVKVCCADGMKIYIMSTKEGEACDNAMLYASLRSPLSNIRLISSCITNIAEEKNDDKLMSYVAPLNRSYFKMKHLLNNASTAERLNRGELACRTERFDFAELCRELINTVKLLMKNEDISIDFESAEHVYVTADRDLMEQMLLNLLSNSLKRILPGGTIRVSLTETDSNTIISVDDDGQGIPPQELSKAFECYRYDCESENAAEGLFLVRGIGELHGGTAIIGSRSDGRGTAIRVMIANSTDNDADLRGVFKAYEDKGMDRILTELADNLPLDSYSNLYDD